MFWRGVSARENVASSVSSPEADGKISALSASAPEADRILPVQWVHASGADSILYMIFSPWYFPPEAESKILPQSVLAPGTESDPNSFSSPSAPCFGADSNLNSIFSPTLFAPEADSSLLGRRLASGADSKRFLMLSKQGMRSDESEVGKNSLLFMPNLDSLKLKKMRIKYWVFEST